MHHVIVETNWVVAYAAPAHHRVHAACELLRRAARGELCLHVPAICVSEARKVLDNARFGPRTEAKAVREYVRWAVAEGNLGAADAATARRVVDEMERKILSDRNELPRRLAELRAAVGLNDQSIVAAVLVLGAELASDPDAEVCFATLDSDLQPWGRRGEARLPLVDWYDDAGVRVYGDFMLDGPVRPQG